MCACAFLNTAQACRGYILLSTSLDADFLDNVLKVKMPDPDPSDSGAVAAVGQDEKMIKIFVNFCLF